MRNLRHYPVIVLAALGLVGTSSCARQSASIEGTEAAQPALATQRADEPAVAEVGVDPLANALAPVQQATLAHGDGRVRRYAGAEEIGASAADGLPAATTSAADAAGRSQRVSYERRVGKYPLIRVVETLQALPEDRQKQLARTAMVADHAIVAVQATTREALQAAVAPLGMTVRRAIHGTSYLVAFAVGETDTYPASLAALQQVPGVTAAEPDYLAHASITPVVPNDTRFAEQWALRNTGQDGGTANADIKATTAWAYTTGSRNFAVAIIDTGMDMAHPDLIDNLWANPNPGALGLAGDLHGWDFANDDADPSDDHFHGTHVAGTIGATGNNAAGVTGVNWQVSLVPLKALASDGAGYYSDLIAAITYAGDLGVAAINASWGGGSYHQGMADAITAACAKGTVFIAAAGNNGDDLDTSYYPSYPAQYVIPGLVAVAASTNRDQLASFSNHGTSVVRIAAPGNRILSTMPTVTTAAMSGSGLQPSYDLLSGTSMATPHVAGAVALVMAGSPSLTAAQALDRVLSRSYHVAALFDQVVNGARLDLGAAVNPSWQVPAARIALQSATANDTGTGNGDGYLNPGENITVIPTLVNLGGVPTGACLVTASTTTAGVTIVSPPVAVANLAVFQPTAVPVTVALATTLVDTASITVKFTVQNAVKTKTWLTTSWSGIIFAPKPVAEQNIGFAVSALASDPARNVVYVVDASTPAILGISTTTGTIVARAALPAPRPTTMDGGEMTVSADGKTLYLCRTSSNEILVYQLPSLTPLRRLVCDGWQPYSAALAANGRLYVTSLDYWGYIRALNPATGAVVDSFGYAYFGALTGSFYRGAILRLSPDRKRLLATETGLRTEGGPGSIYAFDVATTMSPVTQIGAYPYVMQYCSEFVLDDARKRVYTVNGGIYGVQVSDIAAGTYGTVWPFNAPYGADVEMKNGARWVYGSSAGPYDATIVRFDATTGARVGGYPLSRGSSYTLRGRATQLTRDGSLVYYLEHWRGDGAGQFGSDWRLGLIGRDTLDLATRPVAVISPSKTVGPGPLITTLTGTASTVPAPSTLKSYRWLFPDGMTSTSATVTRTFSTVGTHRVQLTVTASNGVADTAVLAIDVVPPPVAMIVMTPPEGYAPFATTCSAATSTVTAPATLASYAWDFGDGQSGTGVTAEHVYAEPGTYTVTLLVTASDGQTDTATTTVLVKTTPTGGGGSGTWPCYGGGIAHTGAVASDILPSAAPILLWQRILPTTPQPTPPQPVAIGDGAVYTAAMPYGNVNYVGVAGSYELESGAVRWEYPLSLGYVGAPAYDQGEVLYQVNTRNGDGELHCRNALTGVMRWTVPFNVQWQGFLSPTIAHGRIYAQGGYYGGLYAFDRATGTQAWFQSLPQVSGWTPAADADAVYSFVDGIVRAHNPVSGATSWSVTAATANYPYSMNSRNVALTASELLVVEFSGLGYQAASLVCIDLGSRTQRWRATAPVGSPFRGTPAIAGTVAVVGTPTGAAAYDLTTGTRVAVYTVPGAASLVTQPLVSADAVIVGGAATTVIFDRQSGLPVATLPVAGELALAGSTLVIAGKDGTVRAYRLPPPPAAPQGGG